MVTVEEATISRLKTHGQTFEILVDSEKAIAFKGGGDIDIRDIVAVQNIFSDAKKGLEAPKNALKSIFKTDDVLEVAKAIIKKGEISLTADYRNKLRDEKRKQIIDFIHRNSVDPKTHRPHPPNRIESALEEAKFHVDEYKPLQKQVEEAVKAIRSVLPIKFEIKEIAVKIPAEFAAKSYNILNSFGKRLKEEWQNDGSLIAVIELPGGLEEDFYAELNKLCHGDIETKLLRTR